MILKENNKNYPQTHQHLTNPTEPILETQTSHQFRRDNIISQISKTVNRIINFEDILNTPEEVPKRSIPKSISFHFFINPLSGKKAGELLTQKKIEKFRVKKSHFESLPVFENIKEIDITTANLKDDITRISLIDQVSRISNLPNSEKSQHLAYVLILGGDGSVAPILEELQEFKTDFSKIFFGVFPFGNYNDLASCLNFKVKGNPELRKVTKKRKLKKLKEKNDLKEYFQKLSFLCLKSEIEEMDVWEVEMECESAGCIRTMTRNKYAGNRLEILKERSRKVRRAKRMIDRKSKNKEEAFFKNKLVFKFAEKIQNDIVKGMEKFNSEQPKDDRVSTKLEKIKLDRIVTGKETPKLSFKKLMLCHVLLGEEAKEGLRKELNEGKKTKLPSKLISKVKNLNKIIIKKKKNSLENLVSKIEISRGIGAREDDSEMDSILEEVQTKTVTSHILKMADNYKQMLQQVESDDDSERESRKVVNWNFLSRTIYDSDVRKDRLKGSPQNLIWMNVNCLKKKSQSLWKHASKKSAVVKEDGSKVFVDEKMTRMDDGKLELLTYKKKSGFGAGVRRISQSNFLNFFDIFFRSRTIFFGF